MRVLADVEVDLGDALQPHLAVGVEQQGDVDPVAGDEREPLEELAAGGDLAARAGTPARSG